MLNIIKENIKNLSIIRNVAKYEDKSNFQSNRLGILWKYLNPLFQILITFLIFSQSYGKSSNNTYPYLVWLSIGIIVWTFISGSILAMSRSIFSQIATVSKSNFPISTLPTIALYSNFLVFAVLNIFLLLITFIYKVPITMYWIQIIYYVTGMIYFLFAIGILLSTLSVVFRDLHVALVTIIRILFLSSGVFLDIVGTQNIKVIGLILENNPIYYLINGYRESILSTGWFYQKPAHALFFWSFSTIIFIIGIRVHLKFRSDLSIYS